ncbi:hypothetical protein VKT23_017453 [Stygiomarasmius scandens]|uniref:DUF6534 domain-containing protein n=1 Tax=Marasmiellus scandens TaxID=2682957 RepID=A0ABR1IRU8_9AGAR
MGIVIVQVYIYYMSFPQDRLWMKASVYILFALDIIQTVAMTSSTWSFLVSGWGRPEHLHLTEWGFAFIPMICGVCSAGVQLFFAWRIYILASRSVTKKLFLPVIFLIVSVSCTQCIASIISSARWTGINDVLRFHLVFPTISIWLAGSAVADVLIAISMIYLLNTARAKTKNTPVENIHIQRTNHLLARLIRNTIETGAITAGAAILDVVFFLARNDTTLHFFFSVSLSKLYTNTFYASLNARTTFQRDSERMASFHAAEGYVSSQTTNDLSNERIVSAHQISFGQKTTDAGEGNWQNQKGNDTIPMVRMGKSLPGEV